MSVLIFILLSGVSGYAQSIDSILIEKNTMIYFYPDLLEIDQLSSENFSWNGGVVNGKASGEGSLTYKGKRDTIETYTGAMKEGYFHGKGKLIYINGRTFTGNFTKGLRNGIGVLRYGPGSHRFEGTWKNNRLHGKAVEIGTSGNTEESYRVSLWENGIFQKYIVAYNGFALEKYFFKRIKGDSIIQKKVYYSQDTLGCFQELHIEDQYYRGILRIVLYYPEGGFEPYRIAIYKGNTYGPYFNGKTVLLSMDVTFSNIGDLISYDVNYFKGKCFLKKHLHLLHLLNCRGDNVHQLTWEEILAASKRPKFSWARHDRLIRQKEREEKQRISSQENTSK